MAEYLFTDPSNTACISCTHVTIEGHDILFVSHDADDGMWQFLCGSNEHTEDDGVIVGLGEIVNLDPGLNEIADMPLGICGERKSKGDEWKFYKL